jgi:ABC-2 type transport system ATP-binding protein
VINVKNLTKIYGNKIVALDNITFSSSANVVCLLGRNGAGKTTLLRILSTQLLPTSGTAEIEGYDVIKEPEKIRKIIASIPQESRPVGIASPLEHVVMYLTARGYSLNDAFTTARKSLKEVGLWDVATIPTDELSGGMKRKVFVAMAIASNADVVLLDEPTLGLDPISRLEVWYILEHLNSKLILTTHYMEEAKELAQEIIVIHKGKIVAKGTINELLKPFNGKVRIESNSGDYKIGNNYISYVTIDKAKEFIGKDVVIKPITLEDLLIINGMEAD